MGKAFASGKHAFGYCDRCGVRVDYNDLIMQYENLRPTGLLVCGSCLDVDHPQLQLGKVRMDDPQALKDARPDVSFFAPGNQGAGGSRMTQWGWNPIGGGFALDGSVNDLVSTWEVGQVSVSTDYSV